MEQAGGIIWELVGDLLWNSHWLEWRPARNGEKPFYAKEMEVVEFLNQPGESLIQALLLRYRPLNMDVLPLYIVLMVFLPLILQIINWRANLTLAISVALYTLSWQYDLHLTAYPNGF